MHRRQAIHSLGLISTHTLFPSVLSGFLASCQNGNNEKRPLAYFTSEELANVIELIDIIIPATNTLSASQTQTQYFLDEVFAKCLSVEQQKVIKKGIELISKGFKENTDKLKFIQEIDKKAYEGKAEYAFFKTIKQGTLIGYFTSQEGETKASNYVKVPEAYKGEVSVTEKTLNYGKTNLTFNL